MKFYPPGPVTPYGSKLLLERIEPLVTYESGDNTITWSINGGLAPWPGVQEGAFLADGVKGLHPPFTFIEYKGARQHGVTVQHTVYDPAEYDMEVEFTVPPDHVNPRLAASAIRRVIREWIASWEPDTPGKLVWVTPDQGQWYCHPRLFRSPPESQFREQARRLRQKYTWTIRNDDAFWKGVDSVSDFKFGYKLARDTFNRDDAGTLGPQWSQTYSAPNGVSLSDNFNRANAASLGANWVDRNGGFSIVGNTAAPETTVLTTGSHVTPMDSDDMEVSVTLAANVGTGDLVGIILGANAAGEAVWAFWDATTVYIYTMTSWASAGSVVRATTATTRTTGDVLKLRRVGNVYSTYKNGVAITSSTWTDSGNVVPRDGNHRFVGMVVDGSPSLSNYTPADAWSALALAGGVCETDPKGFASWTPSGLLTREVRNRLLGINEIQTVNINGVFSGGTWTYTVNGQTTAGIAYNASATTFQTAIEALSNVAPGDVTVAGPNGGPYVVTYMGALAFTNITSSASGASLTPGGTAGAVKVGTTVDGTGPNTATDNQVITLAIGDAYQFPFPTGGSLDIWGRWNGNDASPTGIRARIGQGLVTLSRFNAGVETVMKQEILFISPAWWEEWRLVCGSSVNARDFAIQRGNFTRLSHREVGTGSSVGSGFRGSGFGMQVGVPGFLTTVAQQVPPSVDEFSVGDNVTVTQSGHLKLTNFGDQPGSPRYLCYGPGTFRIANGPTGAMVEFGPLTDNQVALLTTIPRLRGVVDLSPDAPQQDLDGFQEFVKALLTFAVGNNTPPLLEWFESLLGIRPPQGELYSLLRGRFTAALPPKPAGDPPPTVSIACEVVNGNADSKIIAALTPLRRWPE